jgi:quercetin dioxygenase-like cupin family protein
MRVTWPRPGHRAIAHIHPGMQERWEVVRGRAGFDIDGVVTEVGPGEAVVAEAGQRHLAWNASDTEAELRIEMRPALRWTEFVRRLFGGEPPATLLAEFAPEVRIG